MTLEWMTEEYRKETVRALGAIPHPGGCADGGEWLPLFNLDGSLAPICPSSPLYPLALKAHREGTYKIPRNLGNPPRGFQYADGGFPCDDFDPAFVRGILLPTSTYDAMSFDQKFALQNVDVYPRWRLYGGPFKLKQDADAWDNYLFFWGFNSGQTWISHGTVCIVPPSVLAWPADQGVRWDWIMESRKPDLAQKVWNPQAGRYEIKWV